MHVDITSFHHLLLFEQEFKSGRAATGGGWSMWLFIGQTLVTLSSHGGCAVISCTVENTYRAFS